MQRFTVLHCNAAVALYCSSGWLWVPNRKQTVHSIVPLVLVHWCTNCLSLITERRCTFLADLFGLDRYLSISIKHEDPTWKKILHLDQKPISWYSLVRFGEQVRQAQPVPPFNANVHLKCWKKNYWENKKLQWTYFRSRRISWKITNYIKYYYYLVRSKFSLNSCCCPRKRNLTFYI